MDPSTRIELMWALALLPVLIFVPLVVATLLAPVSRDARRRLGRDGAERFGD